MAQHVKDIDGVVHSEAADGCDYTLCGNALEGVNGDTEMVETSAGIDCEQCIRVIEFCKRIRAGEIKAPYQRRRA
jgi:hypothetical protein